MLRLLLAALMGLAVMSISPNVYSKVKMKAMSKTKKEICKSFVDWKTDMRTVCQPKKKKRCQGACVRDKKKCVPSQKWWDSKCEKKKKKKKSKKSKMSKL